MTYILTKNRKYSEYWRENIPESQTLHVNKQMNLKSDDVIITDGDNFTEIKPLHEKVVVLDNEPTFEKFLYYTKKGIKAYGNIYMHGSHILSALQSVKEGKVWMYPDFMSKMMRLSSVTLNNIDEKLKPLTRREKETAILISEGLTNKEIAIKLNLSANTVKVHTANIYRKLNITDRLSLLSYLR